MNKIVKTIAKLVYPDGLCCISCGNEMFVDDRADVCFCKKCLPQRNAHYCKICGVGLPKSTQDYCNSCLHIGKEGIYFDAARAPYLYRDDSVKAIVHDLKYNGGQYLAEYMSKAMIEVVKAQDWKIDEITYVPLHWRKEQKRGYNQSKCLAKYISEALNIPLTDALKKTVYTRTSAARLGKDDRKKLLEGTFALNKDVNKKNILLVDDVMTSKATSNECSKTLKEGKAKHVYVITFATSVGDNEQTY